MKFQKLFQRGKIGNLDIKNRIVMTSMVPAMGTANGEITDEYIRYYEERAKGGTGLIITGAASIDDETGRGGVTHSVAVTNRNHQKPMEKLARVLHKYDTKVFMQLVHPGKETHSIFNDGKAPVAPSAIMTRHGEMTHALTVEEIKAIVKKFVNGAVLVKAAGVDGVEIHGAHGYLLNEFMTPLFNKREDEYGGSFENRMRFITEVYQGIRQAVGEHYPVGVRISGDEFIEGGNTTEDGVKIAKYMEELGVDWINVTVGVQETSHFNREPASFQQGWKKNVAKSIKAAVNVPVIAVNTIKKPDFAESMLQEGVCDFIGLARGQLADPFWANKAKSGNEDEIRTCISCLVCFEELASGRHMKCSVNPKMGREAEFDHLNKNGNNQPVAVVGGGPGGMEAAVVLAKRGFDVTLFEKSEQLGGQLNYANKPPLKEKITWLMEGMIAQVKKAGVKVKLNTEATLEELKALNPVGVFVCCGSDPIRPGAIEGIFNDNVYTVPEVLSGKKVLDGKDVVVIGSGLAGLETAVYLGDKGCTLSIVEMKDAIGEGIFITVLQDVLRELEPYSPKMYPKHKLSKVTKEGVEVTDEKGEVVTIKAEAVLLAMGVKPRKEVVEMVQSNFDNVVLVGDSIKDGRIVDATRDGCTKAWVFEV